jgi:hypothetical protein
MRSPNDTLPPLPYERAPEGAEDKWRLTRDVTFRWSRPPKWILKSLSGGGLFLCDEGILHLRLDPDGTIALLLTVYAGFCFSVSVAPDFARALAAACLHDWLYKHAEAWAANCGISVRKALHIADHWFLAQMRASGFLLKRTYFCAVRIFGYAFNSLFSP